LKNHRRKGDIQHGNHRVSYRRGRWGYWGVKKGEPEFVADEELVDIR
jgi:hypothetical protein